MKKNTACVCFYTYRILKFYCHYKKIKNHNKGINEIKAKLKKKKYIKNNVMTRDDESLFEIYFISY